MWQLIRVTGEHFPARLRMWNTTYKYKYVLPRGHLSSVTLFRSLEDLLTELPIHDELEPVPELDARAR